MIHLIFGHIPLTVQELTSVQRLYEAVNGKVPVII